MKLAVCMQYRNEQDYIEEFVLYHQLIGVDKLILIDNNTDDNTNVVLKPYVDSGLVDIIPWPGETMRVAAYSEMLLMYSDYDWIAFLDGDEFIYSPEGHDIKELLARYHKYDRIEVRWWIFGSNGQRRKLKGLVIERFTKCGPYYYIEEEGRLPYQLGIRKTCKTILQPGNRVKCKSAHLFEGGRVKMLEPNELRLNHYSLKSVEEFNWKMNVRGRGTDYPRKGKGMYWKKFDINEEDDTGMLKYAVAINKLLL